MVAFSGNVPVTVRLSPIPVLTELTIEGISTDAILSVINVAGKTVLTAQLTAANRTTLDVSALPAGVYTLLISGEAAVTPLRFVKR